MSLTHEQLIALQQGAEVQLVERPLSKEEQRKATTEERKRRRKERPADPSEIPEEILQLELRLRNGPDVVDETDLYRFTLAVLGGPDWRPKDLGVSVKAFYSAIQDWVDGTAVPDATTFGPAKDRFTALAKVVKAGDFGNYPSVRHLVYGVVERLVDLSPPHDQLWYLRTKVVLNEIAWRRTEYVLTAGATDIRERLAYVVDRKTGDMDKGNDLRVQLEWYRRFRRNSLEKAVELAQGGAGNAE